MDDSSSLVSKNITVLGRRTSVRLEPEMWIALYDIAKRENCTIHEICSLISLRKRGASSLTASIRVFMMLYFKAAATEDGHGRAGHGNFDRMKSRARVQGSMIITKSGGTKQVNLGNAIPAPYTIQAEPSNQRIILSQN
ncbi:MAG: ribbon-helix-helix domain-containing protein [Pseudomonadota bacterium]